MLSNTTTLTRAIALAAALCFLGTAPSYAKDEADKPATQAELAALQADLDAAEAALVAAEADILTAEGDIVTLQADLDAAEADLLALQADLDSEISAREALEGAIATLEADSAALQEQIDALQPVVVACPCWTADTIVADMGFSPSHEEQFPFDVVSGFPFSSCDSVDFGGGTVRHNRDLLKAQGEISGVEHRTLYSSQFSTVGSIEDATGFCTIQHLEFGVGHADGWSPQDDMLFQENGVGDGPLTQAQAMACSDILSAHITSVTGNTCNAND